SWHPVLTLSLRHLSAQIGVIRSVRDICLGHVYTWMPGSFYFWLPYRKSFSCSITQSFSSYRFFPEPIFRKNLLAFRIARSTSSITLVMDTASPWEDTFPIRSYRAAAAPSLNT